MALLFSSDVMKENERTRTEKSEDQTSQSHHGIQQRKIKKEAPDFINLDENDYVEINDEGQGSPDRSVRHFALVRPGLRF